ncbi:unnamed protein product [Rhizoctonia solani]|uniref:F-box domain-containing protein n=1 Tax=Rhizoctonia solani TaxID=456999 RepID=A0A8H3BLF6_9AGAM|nr:unnamed protein product [Rhizoctonia solani]
MHTRSKNKDSTILGVEDERVGMGTDEDYGRNAEFGPGMQESPPQKRPRNSANATRAPGRKKQVRNNHGLLDGLMNMPIDIFTEVSGVDASLAYTALTISEITSHLLPIDIITLSRLNKFFRNALMHRSLIHIWHGSMRNVPGLPDCPADMSEPSYLALVFLKTCTKCGDSARGKPEGELRVRLCEMCHFEYLIPIEEVPAAIRIYVPRSNHIIIPEHKLLNDQYALSEDVWDLQAEYRERKQLKDENALGVWIHDKTEKAFQRQKEAEVLTQFFDRLDDDREKELKDLKETRRLGIKRRLKDLGWTDEDIPSKSGSEHYRAWNALVNQPKPLTERIWEIFNRNWSLCSRPVLLTGIKDKVYSTLTLQVREYGLFPGSIRSSSRDSNHEVFPSLAHALALPLIKGLYETDWTSEEMEAKLEEHREEIEVLVNGWRSQVQTHFLSQAVAHDMILRPVLVSYDGNPEPFITISDDIKRLLRADSIFYTTPLSEDQKIPSAYISIIFSERLIWTPQTAQKFVTPKPLNLEHIFWYPEAHEAAREILNSMSKPDVSYMEITGYPLTHIYMCGRCHDTTLMSWEKMIQHYVEQKQLHSDVQKDLENLAGSGIMYNDIHDPALSTDLPMIKHHATQVQTKIMDVRDEGLGRFQMCKLCEMIPSVSEVVVSQSFILRHLRDVHGIIKPKFDEHYAPKC